MSMRRHLISLLLFLSGTVQLLSYADNMGYLELRLQPGTPALQLTINNRNRGQLTPKTRRFYLKTGVYRIRISGRAGGFRYSRAFRITVQEDLTIIKTVRPQRVRIPGPKTPAKIPPAIKKTGKTAPGSTSRKKTEMVKPVKRYAGKRRPVLFIRPIDKSGVTITLYLNSTFLGRLQPGTRIRSIAETGTKHWLLIRKNRSGQRWEEQRIFLLERAVGPMRILIHP